MTAAPAVLYIVGASRSGTTLAADLLGQHAGVANLGELHWLGRRGLDGPNACGCGQPIGTCPYWQEVVREAFGSDHRSTLQRYRDLHARCGRTRHLAGWLGSKLSPDRVEYAELRARATIAAAKVAAVDTVVDPSKFPVDALALQWAGMAVTTLHVVRDPRGVVFSWSTPKLRPDGIEVFTPAKSTVASVADWTLLNVSAETVRRRIPGPRLQYEAMVTSPERLTLLVEWDEPPANDGDLLDHHTFDGNPRRTTRRVGAVDARWRRELTAWDKVLTTALTAPLLRRYGYRLGWTS